MSKQKIRIKSVNQDETVIRAPNQILKSLRYLFGNMSTVDFLQYVPVEDMKNLELLWIKLSNTDLRSANESRQEPRITRDDQGLPRLSNSNTTTKTDS